MADFLTEEEIDELCNIDLEEVKTQTSSGLCRGAFEEILNLNSKSLGIVKETLLEPMLDLKIKGLKKTDLKELLLFLNAKKCSKAIIIKEN